MRSSALVPAGSAALLSVIASLAALRPPSTSLVWTMTGTIVVTAAAAACAWCRYAHLRAAVRSVLEAPARKLPGRGLALELQRQWAGLKHRTMQANASTGLPTREPLLERMARDLDAGDRTWTLGLLEFAEFDQLLAFDDEGARNALALLGARIAQASGERRFVGHVDRATFAVWFKAGDAREALGAIAYVAGQQLPLSAGVLTPTLRCSLVEAGDDGRAERLLAQAIAALPLSVNGRPAPARRDVVEEERERFQLDQDLARAIAGDQLRMVFQPVVDLAAGRVTGAEALLRWDHPTLGEVPPSRFIPAVERTGLSERYGLWVLNAACREAARWRAEGLGGLRMAVNLSAKQVLDPELETKIERTLARHGLDSRALELELTETAAMVDADRTFALFTRLRARGVSLAIDDFGTGYSSLSYLKNLPFTKLKIDREFVTAVDTRAGSRAICKALLELGRGLDLVVLAEGAETAAEVETLRRLGCTVFQGFHFSRPLAGPDFVSFARTFPPRAPVRPALSNEFAR